MDRFPSRKIVGVAFCSLICLSLGLSQAHAGFTIALDSAAPNGGGASVFNYSATIASGDSIVAGDYFRIYDFSGYVAGSAIAPTGWSVTANYLDPIVPPSFILVHGDDAAIPNLTFTYDGTSPIDLKGFSAVTANGTTLALASFFGTNHNASLPAGLISSTGDVSVPKAGNISPQPAPEPASIVSTALGVAIAGLFLRRRARRLHDAGA
jgi:hypothetical protein